MYIDEQDYIEVCKREAHESNIAKRVIARQEKEGRYDPKTVWAEARKEPDWEV